MQLLPRAQPWRKVLLVVFVLFLGTRAWTLMAFPIFNDEAIYLQYSQLIHEDWGKNKFISVQNEYDDWKPPLQFWLGAPVIRWGGDPLLAGRSVALLVSLLGFLGFYLFSRELFGEREGVITAALYALCPPVLFHNNQFIAETFLFSTAPWVYWTLLRAMRPNKWRGLWLLAATLSGTALLLFKQSGFLLLAVAIFLPWTQFGRMTTSAGERPRSGGDGRWKELLVNLLLVASVIVAAQLAANAILSTASSATRDQFNSKWVMSPRELFALPMPIWRANLHRVSDYIGAYYSWLVPALVGVFLWFAFRRKNLADLVLVLMGLAGAFAVTFLLRGFNEYLFNTAIIAVLLPILARTGVLVWNLSRTGPSRFVRTGLLAACAITLVFWCYQIVLFGISPGKYIERSTPWAVANYLSAWPTGFSIKEVVALLEKEKRPGIILADAQWGNPRLALEIYGKERFPNLRILPFLRVFTDRSAARALRERAQELAPVRFAIFSADPSGKRRAWQEDVAAEMCETRTTFQSYPGQMPIVVCQF